MARQPRSVALPMHLISSVTICDTPFQTANHTCPSFRITNAGPPESRKPFTSSQTLNIILRPLLVVLSHRKPPTLRSHHQPPQNPPHLSLPLAPPPPTPSLHPPSNNHPINYTSPSPYHALCLCSSTPIHSGIQSQWVRERILKMRLQS